MGGPAAGGQIASTVMSPTISGYQKFDLYEALSKPTGDLTAAKQQLAQCGQPNGFSTNLSYRSDRPAETAAGRVSGWTCGCTGSGCGTSPYHLPASDMLLSAVGLPALGRPVARVVYRCGDNSAAIAERLNAEEFCPPKRTKRFTGEMVRRLTAHRGFGWRQRHGVQPGCDPTSTGRWGWPGVWASAGTRSGVGCGPAG